MDLTCLSCNHEYTGILYHDDLGFHGVCPKCGASFPVELPKGRYAIAYADDSDPEKDFVNFTDFFPGPEIRSYKAFDTRAEFIAAWKKEASNPHGMWYWLLDDGELFCGGAVDPDDKKIICWHFCVSSLAKAIEQEQENVCKP